VTLNVGVDAWPLGRFAALVFHSSNSIWLTFVIQIKWQKAE
jgi:hypothetical protein